MQLSQDVHEYPINDELVLFLEKSRRLYRTNPTATLIWNGIRAGLKRQELINLLAQAFKLSKKKVIIDLENILLQWRSFGLLESDSMSIQEYNDSVRNHQQHKSYDKTIPPPTKKRIKTYYRLLNCQIVLSLPDGKIADKVHPIIAHIQTHELLACDLSLEIRKSVDAYLLLSDGLPIDWCEEIREVAPMVHANIPILAYEHSNCLAGIHAAAVQWNQKCILMPALSGSGKSTLTGALVGCGLEYCSDDMVLLTHKPVKAHPASVSIGLKKGSWQIIKKYHPVLDKLPIHVRKDGRSIRYLSPLDSEMAYSLNKKRSITHIVLPKYKSGSSAKINPISQAAGLCRIAEAGYDVHGKLNPAMVKQLVDWIKNIPCFEFVFGDLEEAVNSFKSLLSEK